MAHANEHINSDESVIAFLQDLLQDDHQFCVLMSIYFSRLTTLPSIIKVVYEFIIIIKLSRTQLLGVFMKNDMMFVTVVQTRSL